MSTSTVTTTAGLRQRPSTLPIYPSSTSSSSAASSAAAANASVSRAPSQKTPFTVGDLRRAIPAHCFEHSLITSFSYLFLDLAMVFALYSASTQIEVIFTNDRFGALFGFFLRHVCWTAYWFAQGVVLTGLWVLGHECGHGGFASQSSINDIVGFIVHSALLVPYFSWKISHRRHHSNTGNIDRDEVFVPEITSSENHASLKSMIEHENDSYPQQIYGFVTRVTRIIFMLTFGWMSYLWLNATSNKSYPKQSWVNHFIPSSPLFTDSERRLVLLSDIGMIVQLSILYVCSSLYGFSSVFYVYGVPYMVNVGFLVLITFLQHTDLKLPHYDATEWDWLRGALATVDRDFGILNFFHHHIADTHVCHHLFSYLPHYHAQEATDALKAVLGPYYIKDDTPILTALYNSYKHCPSVVPDPYQKGVYWF